MAVKDIFKNWRVIMLVIFVIFALVAIKPQLIDTPGVTIRSVAGNSTAALGGIESPTSNLAPLQRERVTAINNQKVNSVDDYLEATSLLVANQTVRVRTDKQTYTLLTSSSSDAKKSIDLGINIYETPSSNLRKGLDLEGGTRVLLEPEGEINDEDLDTIIESLKQRLNVYGLSDVVVRSAADLSGKQFILVEIAGVTQSEVRDLLSKQGKFEAKIANQTVFFGGDKDVTYVCRSAECSGLSPYSPCGATGDGYGCGFFFAITLSPQAAARHAKITDQLTIVGSTNPDPQNSYLSEDLVLYLDDKEVDRLRIGADLKGRETSNIQISGSGTGGTIQEAQDNTLQEMKSLQTVLITGSLPVKLSVAKMDTISPSLGKEFLSNILLVAILVIVVVVTVVLIRYRKLEVVVPMVSVLISEIVLILGFAAFVGWNLDLAGIAGILIVAGTGVDHLIVITDETINGTEVANWKHKIKNAMFIIMGAYFTTLSGMFPLLWAGAGLLKGFALTTIAGISFGVLIARPAYAAIIEILLGDK
jgi:preprotein translocase subunit SecD